MSIVYDCSGFADPAAWQDDERWPRTSNLILMCAVLGINKVSNDNDVREYYMRAKLYERLFPPFLVRDPESVTREDAESLRGLTTNVTPETRVSWSRRMTREWFSELEKTVK
jgi:hypothetical protein